MKSNKVSQQYVGIVMVRKDGSVLLQHRDNKPNIGSPNMFAICGGRKEKADKTLKHAAARELEEETGYIIKTNDLHLLCRDEFDTENGWVTRDFYWCMYDEEQPIKCLEGQSIKFYDIENLDGLKFCDPYHKRYLEEASEKNFSLHNRRHIR